MLIRGVDGWLLGLGSRGTSCEEEGNIKGGQEDLVLYLSSEGEGEMGHASASSGTTSPVAPVSPHVPRSGRKITLRHPLVKGMFPHGRTDPGYKVCLYSHTHTQDLLGVVACLCHGE